MDNVQASRRSGLCKQPYRCLREHITFTRNIDKLNILSKQTGLNISTKTTKETTIKTPTKPVVLESRMLPMKHSK